MCFAIVRVRPRSSNRNRLRLNRATRLETLFAAYASATGAKLAVTVSVILPECLPLNWT
ncbi:unnamed protein product [Soboliphyme baturini]|uniref:Transposase n=1 Tax=Soboliphyme baturini TaxID=241478 RepID=A0A183JAI5_9BILA|nr:unnamed protein product [Soboliphyme baturini]